MIQEIMEKIKGNSYIHALLKDERYFTACLLVLVALTSFGLGKQSAAEGEDQNASTVESQPNPTANNRETASPNSTFYVGSVNSDVYHLPHCSGAERISEANKITFATKAEAEAAGYRPAANCKGI